MPTHTALPWLLAACASLSGQPAQAQSSEARDSQGDVELTVALASITTDAEGAPLPDAGTARGGELRAAVRAARWLSIETQLQIVASRRSNFVPSMRVVIQPTHGRLAPFATLGLGLGQRPPTTDLTVGSSSMHSEVGLGLRLGLAHGLSLRAEYRFSNGSWKDPDGGSNFWGFVLPTEQPWSARALSLGVAVRLR